VYNVIIIGGMAAGCKAASRLSRLSSNYQITIIEKSPFISLSKCGLPFFVSGELNDISELSKTPYGVLRDEKFFKDFEGINVLTKTEVFEIDPSKQELLCHDLDNNKNIKLNYDALLIATGSRVIKPDFTYKETPRISSVYSPSDSIKIRTALQKGEIKKAVIIGGGFAGCETAESLVSLWGIEITLIEKENSLFSSYFDPEISKHIEYCIKSDNILLLLSNKVEQIESDINGFPVTILDNGQKIISDHIFISLGLQPEVELARKININIGDSGGIIVDEKMRTNIPNIWAAGDCVETKNLITASPGYFPSGSIAGKMGRAAADSINGRKISFKGTAGTITSMLFDNVICSAGLTETKAEESGYKTGSVIGIWSDRADYHPEVKNIVGKLVYTKPGLKLLGLQLIGEGEVTRYIDPFTELLKERKSINSLLCLEHAFTHAHSSPFSPLNYLGYIAINQEKDGIINFSPRMLSSFNGIFIDVREKHEVEAKPFPENSINIPFSSIRLKINDFDLEQEIIFVCTKGSRSYETTRLFLNHGFTNVAYLGGGSLLFTELSKLPKFEEILL
jgi:NADPH-dependent 2,4-dienoyl-CoA reductase/sulfur reductase-like enzyme/rhodanese-related sulfurtransferase